MSNKYNLFLGRAGQAFAKSELLCRGWNTAVPDVDMGDDIFVVEHYDANFYRVQVKTASAQKNKSGYSVRYKIPLRQLKAAFGMELFYIFVIRLNDTWQPPLIISRARLNIIYKDFKIGTSQKDYLLLHFNFNTQKQTVTCSGQSFNNFVNNWADFPLVQL